MLAHKLLQPLISPPYASSQDTPPVTMDRYTMLWILLTPTGQGYIVKVLLKHCLVTCCVVAAVWM